MVDANDIKDISFGDFWPMAYAYRMPLFNAFLFIYFNLVAITIDGPN